jgi:hypothetical protein
MCDERGPRAKLARMRVQPGQFHADAGDAQLHVLEQWDRQFESGLLQQTRSGRTSC